MQRIIILIRQTAQIRSGLQTGCQLLRAGEDVIVVFLDVEFSGLTASHAPCLEMICRNGGNWYAVESGAVGKTGDRRIGFETAAGLLKMADAVLTF